MDREEVMQVWWETAYGFIIAMMSQNAEGLARLLAPGSDIELAYGIFGFTPLVFLTKAHLGFDGVMASRAAWETATGKRPRIEVTWVDQARQTITAEHVTFHLTGGPKEWQVTWVEPTSLDEPLTVEAARALYQDQQGDPYALGLLAGALQLPREGPEPLDAVETLFVEGMQERGFALQEILNAVRVWRDFVRQATPRYRKPEGYAAAVEYIMVLLGFYEDSQTELAAAYGVSENTISRNYRAIRDELDIVQYDRRYSVIEHPSAAWEAVYRQLGLPGPAQLPLGTGRPGMG